jgi:hypothetical protein
LEIRTWVLAQAASGTSAGRLLEYQPMPEWNIGIGVMTMGAGS